MTWERALEADARRAAKNALLIRAALRQSFDPERAFIGYQNTTPDLGLNLAQQRSRARAWAMLNLRINLEPFKEVMLKVWADGFQLGNLAAEEAIIEARRAIKSEVKGGVDWSTWKPGDEASAVWAKNPGMLRLLLQSQGITWKGFSETTINDIGNAIGEAISLGLSAKQSAKLIRNHVASPARALTIAITEQNRAISMATQKRYADAGLQKMEWLVFQPCVICKVNENTVVEIGKPFPSGDIRPPVHPNCRCALGPVIPGYNDRPVTVNNQPIETPSTGGITEISTPAPVFASPDQVVSEAKRRFKDGKRIDISDYIGKPEARTYDSDRAKMGEIIHAQGWDKPVLSLSPEEFDALVAEGPGNKGLSLFYRGGPAGMEEGFLTGKPFIGDGNAGPGIYITNRVDRADTYADIAAKQTGGSELIQILVPSEVYQAPNRQSWVHEQKRDRNPLPAPINQGTRADTLQIAAEGGHAYSSVDESQAGDFVIFDPSMMIIRRNK